MCCTYRRGLSALSVLERRYCEDPKCRTNKGKIPTLSLYITLSYFSNPFTSRESRRHISSMNMIHAGQLIQRTLHDQGRTVTWFAAQLCCTRPNVYKIFRKENIDIHLLWRISYILKYTFFSELADAIDSKSTSNVSK